MTGDAHDNDTPDLAGEVSAWAARLTGESPNGASTPDAADELAEGDLATSEPGVADESELAGEADLAHDADVVDEEDPVTAHAEVAALFTEEGDPASADGAASSTQATDTDGDESVVVETANVAGDVDSLAGDTGDVDLAADGTPVSVGESEFGGDGVAAGVGTGESAVGALEGEGDTERDMDPEPVPDLAGALEAVLMVVDEPIPSVQFAQVLETPRVEVEATLRRLAEEYTASGRGFDLREVAGGWRFYSRPECASVVERFILDGQQARLTQAALETLAVVAYRQPVSRARVSAIRGVNCDGVVRTLVSRGLIQEAGTEQESNAVLYRTTILFLERLGLQSVDDLPDIAPYLPEVDEFSDTEDVPG